MILLLPLPFLALGCLCFVVCASVPPARRYALGSSLLFAVWGALFLGTLVGLMLLGAGMLALKDALHTVPAAGLELPPTLLSGHVRLVAAGLLLVPLIVACVISFGHGWMLRRMTLPLFRFYLTGVALGVGLLVATPLAFSFARLFHMQAVGTFALALPCIPVLAAALAWWCFTHANDFRSPRPDWMNPVQPGEYNAEKHVPEAGY